MKTFITLLVILIVALVSAKKTTFNGHSVVLLRINNEKAFQKFSQMFPVSSLDMWSEKYSAKEDMEIRFTKEQMMKLLRVSEVTAKNYINFEKFEIVIQDLQKTLDAESMQMLNHRQEVAKKMKLLKTQKERDDLQFSDEEWFKSYHTLAENLAYINKLATDYPTMVDKDVIGKTVEGRDIVILRIHAPGQYDPSKPSIFMESLQHAREWVGAPTLQYTIKNLLSGYNKNSRTTSILNGLNIHYVPILNVDGFAYTFTNRMWRKNRKRNPRGSYGVDLNRNWRSGFGGPGSSGSETSEVYRGLSVFSEPETKAVDDYLRKYQGQMKGAIDYHAYSQLNLRPWGKIRTESPDEIPLRNLGAEMMEELKKVHGKTYRNIRAAQLYQAGGLASDDWYESHRLIAYTYELRPASAREGGFALPARFILPCAEENHPATLTMCEHIIKKFSKNDDTLNALLKEIK